MSRTYIYVCPDCRNTVTRGYRVPSVVRTCENGCGFDHYVRAELLEKVSQIPADARPDDWEELSESEKLLVALREGVVEIGDLR